MHSTVERPKVVVAGVVKRADRFLLIQEVIENNEAMWLVPGGKVEFGESLEDAVRREIQEELGLTVTATKFLTHWEAIFPQYKYHTIIFFYLVETEGEPVIGDPKIMAAKFMTVAETSQVPLVYSAKWLFENRAELLTS